MEIISSRELLQMAEGLANKRKLSITDVLNIIEQSISLAHLKRTGIDVRISINQTDGTMQSYRRYLVVEDGATEIGEDLIEFDKNIHIYKSNLAKDSTLSVGDYLEQKLDNFEMSRIGIHGVRQNISNSINEMGNDNIVKEYSNKIGDIVYCTVKEIKNSNILVDINNNATGIIYKNNCIPNEPLRRNDKVRAYVKSVRKNIKGYQIILSRSCDELLEKLFSIEVPEIMDGSVEVKGCVREPGQSAKISVFSRNPVIDAIGSCIGVRGSRIQSVSNELNGERINVVIWHENPKEYIKNALHPANISQIDIDERNKVARIVSDESQMSQIIGFNGQNIRLASALTGWKLDLLNPNEAVERKIKDIAIAEDNLMQQFGVSKNIATLLVAKSCITAEQISDINIEDFVDISDDDKLQIEQTIEKAQNLLFDNMMFDNKAIENLIKIEGIDEQLAKALIKNNIKDINALAELSTDELLDIYKIDETLAQNIIMTARAPWFDNE